MHSLYVPTLSSSQCKDQDASCRKCLPCMTYTQSATTLEAWVVATTMPTARCQTGSGIALMTAKCALLTRATLSPPQLMYSSIGVSMKLSKIQVCFSSCCAVSGSVCFAFGNFLLFAHARQRNIGGWRLLNVPVIVCNISASPG